MPRASLSFGALFAVSLMTASATPAADYYSNPARDVEFSNVQHLGRSPRILMPTLYVKFARWGRVPLALGDTASAGALIDLDAPVSVDSVRELATKLQEDLTNQFKNAGWDVLTEADIKDNAAWTKLDHVKPDKRFGVPFEQGNVNGNPRRYLVVTPGDLPVIAAGATGPAWTMKELVDAMNATVLVPTYTFDVIPFVSGDAAAGGAPVAPRLQLVGVDFDFRTPGLVGGSIRAKVPETSVDPSGTFGVPGVKPDRLPQALQDTAAGHGKLELVLEPDPAALVATGLAVGGGFNAHVVKIISAYAPK